MFPRMFSCPPRLSQITTRLQQFLLQAMLAICLGLFGTAAVHADEDIEVRNVRLEAADGGWNLSADFPFTLPSSLEGAVNKGIPLYFVMEFELTRDRPYWFSENTASASQTIRLSFQPLTRQYRISTGGLQLRFSTLQEALALIHRIRSWRVMEAQAVSPGITYDMAVRMRLDVSQLPKPLQVNAVNSSDWNLSSPWKRLPFTPPDTRHPP